MKKYLFLFLFAFLPMMANAYDVKIDGIYYDLPTWKEKEATVTHGDSKYSDDIVIPSSFIYDGTTYNVTAIGDHAFDDCTDLTSVTIPNSVTLIRGQAFSYCI